MKESLISFETAKLADKKGFAKVETSQNNSFIRGEKEYKRPTQSLLQKWIRDVHNINVESNYLPNIQKYRCLYKPMNLIPKELLKQEDGVRTLRNAMRKYYNNIDYDTYEEALEIGLQEALKLIKI